MEPFELEQLRSRTLASLRRMLDYRRQYDARRALFYRQYIGQRDGQKFPDGVTPRANTFVPYPLSNVETVVSRTSDAFFSFMPWFEVDGSTSADDHASDAMQIVLNKKLSEANVQNAAEQFFRNCAIYGMAALKVDWNWDTKTITKPTAQYLVDPQTQQPIINPNDGQPIIQKIVPQTTTVPINCPRITAVDIYDLLIDPDGMIVAHLTEKTLGQMLREQENCLARTQKPLWEPDALNKIHNEIVSTYRERGDPNSVLVRYAEVWNGYDNSQTVVTFGEDADAIGWKDQRAQYRAASYSSYRLPVYRGNGDILYSGENPFAHKRVPIVFTSYIKLPNEIVGLGAIETTADLTESLNKMVNMITDNWNLGINRRFAYDEGADIDHEALNQFNVPGGKVAVGGNPNEVIAPLPLFTPAQGDYQILDLYRGMIEMTSGVSDFYGKGVGSSGGNRTATGINSVISESNYRFKLFIRNIEVDVFTPVLEMCASMIQQFLTDPEEVAITKQGPGIPKWALVDPAELIGNFAFTLVAANYSTNKMVRQRNLMAFMQAAMQSPYWRQGEGLRELGKVMEIRNIDDLLKSDQEVQAEQQQEQQQEQQMMLLGKMVDTESKVEVAKARHSGSQVAHGGQAKKKEGRPSPHQPEGAIPGVNPLSFAKSAGQQMGANALGLSGMGEVPGA